MIRILLLAITLYAIEKGYMIRRWRNSQQAVDPAFTGNVELSSDVTWRQHTRGVGCKKKINQGRITEI